MSDSDSANNRWTIRGVQLRYRDRATEAAKRKDMPVGTWLCEAIERAIEAERQPMDVLLPGQPADGPADAEAILALTERAIASAVALANAAAVPAAFRRRANRLLRESLPPMPARPARKALPTPDATGESDDSA